MESATLCDYSKPNDYERELSSSSGKSSHYNGSTSAEKYVREWRGLSRMSEDPHLDQLRTIAVNGGLKTSKFRSICWSLLLGVLNGRSQSWTTQRRCDRSRYVELIKQFYINPRMASGDDPLSQSDKSVWNQHFCDKELCTVIKQDVVRTFPGIEFFRKPKIQEIMTNILFCYARVYPEMCYRQGMHEILAPIIFIMHCDHQALLHIEDISAHDVDIDLREVLDPKYLEADSYFIFSKIMTEIESYYRIHDLHPTATGYFPSTPQCASHGETSTLSDLEVVSQLNMIRDKILAKADSQLHNYLLQLDIPLPLFGIRWLRLLFGREFQLLDLLVLWDAIFAEGIHFELTNYIVVAMLISIREEMLHSDYTTALSYLMKYPSNIDVLLIIRHSLHMYAPEKYERPPNTFVLQPKQYHTNREAASGTSSTLPRNIHSKNTLNHMGTKRGNNDASSAPRNHKPSESNKLSPSPSKNDLLREHVNSMQNSTTKATMRVVNPPQLNQEPGIVDGYVENSSEVLKIQLQNAHTVMTITRLKLQQYLSVFRKHIPGDSTHVLHQTMDGIEELCELLKIKEKHPYTLPTPVEAAFEANEVAVSSNRRSIDKPATNDPQVKLEPTLVEAETPKLVRVPIGSLPPLHVSPSKQKHSLRTFYQQVEVPKENIDYVGMTDADAKSSNVRYEIPENGLSRVASLILGNRKELEMHEFSSSKNAETLMARGGIKQRVLPEIDPSGDRKPHD